MGVDFREHLVVCRRHRLHLGRQLGRHLGGGIAQRDGQRDVVRTASTAALRAADEHAPFVRACPLQAVEHRLDGLEEDLVERLFVGGRPGFDVEPAVPGVGGLGVRAVGVDRRVAGEVARLMIADLVLPKAQGEPACSPQ